MQEENMAVVPFSIVGFFVTEGDIESSIRDDISPEELEKFQDLIAKFLFKEGVRVAIYPSVVPPEHATEAIQELEDMIFGEDEGQG